MKFGFEVVAAKPKRDDQDSAPTQARMKPQGLRRNPSTDQKKQRVQMARNASKEHTMDALQRREAEILRTIASASLDEQRSLAVELEDIRSRRQAGLVEAASIELADEIVSDHLTPVVTATHHTAGTDWLGAEPSTPRHEITAAMAQEATSWFNRVTAAVKADPEEFMEQAQGYAQIKASAYGADAEVARGEFLDQVSHLHAMAMPKTATNFITVDGVTYDWNYEVTGPDDWSGDGGDEVTVYLIDPDTEEVIDQVGTSAGSGTSVSDHGNTNASSGDEAYYQSLAEDMARAQRTASLTKKANELEPEDIPSDFEVRPLSPGENPKGKTTCGECGLSWDDDIVTGMTPAPSARCPFEAFHEYDDEHTASISFGPTNVFDFVAAAEEDEQECETPGCVYTKGHRERSGLPCRSESGRHLSAKDPSLDGSNQRMVDSNCTGCGMPAGKESGTKGPVKQRDLGSADKWHHECYQMYQRRVKRDGEGARKFVGSRRVTARDEGLAVGDRVQLSGGFEDGIKGTITAIDESGVGPAWDAASGQMGTKDIAHNRYTVKYDNGPEVGGHNHINLIKIEGSKTAADTPRDGEPIADPSGQSQSGLGQAADNPPDNEPMDALNAVPPIIDEKKLPSATAVQAAIQHIAKDDRQCTSCGTHFKAHEHGPSGSGSCPTCDQYTVKSARLLVVEAMQRQAASGYPNLYGDPGGVETWCPLCGGGDGAHSDDCPTLGHGAAPGTPGWFKTHPDVPPNKGNVRVDGPNRSFSSLDLSKVAGGASPRRGEPVSDYQSDDPGDGPSKGCRICGKKIPYGRVVSMCNDCIHKRKNAAQGEPAKTTCASCNTAARYANTGYCSNCSKVTKAAGIEGWGDAGGVCENCGNTVRWKQDPTGQRGWAWAEESWGDDRDFQCGISGDGLHHCYSGFTATRRQAAEYIADPSGQGVSTLPTVEDETPDDDPAFMDFGWAGSAVPGMGPAAYNAEADANEQRRNAAAKEKCVYCGRKIHREQHSVGSDWMHSDDGYQQCQDGSGNYATAASDLSASELAAIKRSSLHPDAINRHGTFHRVSYDNGYYDDSADMTGAEGGGEGGGGAALPVNPMDIAKGMGGGGAAAGGEAAAAGAAGGGMAEMLPLLALANLDLSKVAGAPKVKNPNPMGAGQDPFVRTPFPKVKGKAFKYDGRRGPRGVPQVKNPNPAGPGTQASRTAGSAGRVGDVLAVTMGEDVGTINIMWANGDVSRGVPRSDPRAAEWLAKHGARTAGNSLVDESGQGVSTLDAVDPTSDEARRSQDPINDFASEVTTGTGAADVATVPTPGQREADYPQPGVTARFRAVVQANLQREAGGHVISPETGQAIVDHGLYWWHRAALKELVRVGKSTAPNIGYATDSMTSDAEKYMNQLEAAGMVKKTSAPPVPPDGNGMSYDADLWNAQQWYEITPLGEDWAKAGQ